MRLATVRYRGATSAAKIVNQQAELLPFPNVSSMLSQPGWEEVARKGNRERTLAIDEISYSPLVSPRKIICVGLNYRSHIVEMGRDLPKYPALFTKFEDTLIGANDDIVLPSTSDAVDWEVELGVVVKSTVSKATEAAAAEAIGGYTVVNDISMRDWQWHTSQWTAGKNYERSTPVGPVLVTPEEIDNAEDLAVVCKVDGTIMQSSRTSDLLFKPASIISYISQFTTLNPGDLIATGTPGGVAAGRSSNPYLQTGQVVEATIEGIGSCTNRCESDK